MTYGELLAQLYELSPEQLKQDVTVYLSDVDDIYPASFIFNTDEDMGEALDSVDIGHPLISA
jgi:hypothetical protein